MQFLDHLKIEGQKSMKLAIIHPSYLAHFHFLLIKPLFCFRCSCREQRCPDQDPVHSLRTFPLFFAKCDGRWCSINGHWNTACGAWWWTLVKYRALGIQGYL